MKPTGANFSIQDIGEVEILVNRKVILMIGSRNCHHFSSTLVPATIIKRRHNTTETKSRTIFYPMRTLVIIAVVVVVVVIAVARSNFLQLD